MFKSLLVLKKSEGITTSNITTFSFSRGIRFKSWRLKNIYLSGSNVKVFLHSSKLSNLSINSTLLGNGENTDSIFLISGSVAEISQDTDRHTFYLNKETHIYELDIYFTDGNSNILNISDFSIILDLLN